MKMASDGASGSLTDLSCALTACSWFPIISDVAFSFAGNIKLVVDFENSVVITASVLDGGT